VTYKVLWPYVPIKVRTDDGLRLREHYAGAFVPDNADPEDVARLLRKGAIVDEHAPEADRAVPAGTPLPEVPPADNPTGGEQPPGNGSREAWAAYATTKGAPDEETQVEGGLTRDELRARYGN
jgi:hypothetical protein